MKPPGLAALLVIYACTAATTRHPLARGGFAGGNYLLGTLAYHTGARVHGP